MEAEATGGGAAARRWASLWLAAAALALAAAQGGGERERPLCAPEAQNRCVDGDYSVDEYFYKVNGRNHMVNFAEGDYYRARCEAAPLGDLALPRFQRLMVFRHVTLTGCAPPAGGSYAAALRALNVSALTRLSLRALPAGALGGGALTGLRGVRELQLHAARALDPDPGCLAPLPALASLALDGVRPPRLPPTLDKLKLRRTGITELPPEALSVLELEISEANLTSFPGPCPRLQTLTLSAPVEELPMAPALERAYVSLWAARAPAPLAGCARLRELTLWHAAAERLPPGLTAACPALQALELQAPALRALPPGLLLNATALRRLKVTQGNITELPPDLFNHSPDLGTLELTFLNLQSLPIGVFSALVGSLRNLSLEGNALRARDVRAAVAPLTGLRRLNLARNPLGDLCPDSSAAFSTRRLSSLSLLRALEELHLSRTGQQRVCADWARDLHALRRLDLRGNAVRALAAADLRVHRAAAPADLDLRDNPLRDVDYTEGDYAAAQHDAIPGERAKIVMNSQITCDCGAYWLARALNDSRVPVAFEPECAEAVSLVTGTRIAAGTALRSVPAEALACALPAAACAAGCACEARAAPRGVRAACGPGAAGRGALPVEELAGNAPAPLLELRARGAALTRLPGALPADLQMLDLYNNSIANASAAAARALVAGARRVRLARNPLRCACDNWPLLAALSAHRAQVVDYENTTCADGRTVEAAVRALRCDADGSYWALALALAGAGAAASAAAAALLARPETRLRLKALLHARARWLVRERGGCEGEDALFDAFVAHADGDARFVYEQLRARLEPARRLCLADRDWPAGAWIPAQLEASVRAARRTVCVVSARWLGAEAGAGAGAGAGAEAAWARAALRAAHARSLRDARPRLVLVLVGVAPAALRADRELAAALDAHAHVRWGEPCFWEKLAYALPDPRPPPAARAPPAA